MAASHAQQATLPLQPTSLVGRDRAVLELAAALNRTRLLTLTGVGGVGKTRLALAVAERVAGSFEDGAWCIELASVVGGDAGLVAQTVAGVVCIPLSPGADALAALVNYFYPRQTLLILDNCEHLVAGCARLADALLRHCAHVQIMATSREPL